ncbi:virulence factor SrfB [Serratia fonticola]|uniref:virulence factor SrfB n=1 Tax=Serratia fonticola TaxID=47917 RepID=UPI0004057D26|nr:virulence factor SrfB [Serratia fonticola]
MLIDLVHYKPDVTLIRDSGVQFLDFGMRLPPDTQEKGYFVRLTANGPLLHLDHDEMEGKFTIPSSAGEVPERVRPESTILLTHSLDVLEGVWLPLPWLRHSAGNVQASGPDNWSRVQIVRLKTPDAAGNTVRVCIAFDTQILADTDADPQLAPTQSDIDNGIRFSFAYQNDNIAAFLDNTWVDGWLREVFLSYMHASEQRTEQDIFAALKAFEYQAHYLNVLHAMANNLALPDILLNGETLHTPTIPVDLILDVGSTHTCGILIEDHHQENDGLRQCAELRLRLLSQPQCISEPLFSSRLEFSEAQFGKAHFSLESGRENAFQWPSIVRLGDEAKQLMHQRTGSEGGSGLSSPRRYLWDNLPVNQPWRFSGKQQKPLATAMPSMLLMNDEGTPLHTLERDVRLPVFTPRYSRASLMTMMLSELLAQALTQMNSPASRQQKGYRNAPRQLRHIILTLPSAMPGQERQRFQQHMLDAIALVWKSLGWHPHDSDFPRQQDKARSQHPEPTIALDWDEASCSQLVWMYNESRRYAGKLDKLFTTLSRPDRPNDEGEIRGNTLRVAAIDIGGGTTDIALTRYDLDTKVGSSIKVTPHLLFREGFKSAGDDLLLEIIRREILPALEAAMIQAGVSDSKNVMQQLFGTQLGHDDQSALRQQATLQLMIPLGHAVLNAWKKEHTLDTTFGALLPTPPTAQVLTCIEEAVRLAGGTLNVLETPLRVDPETLNTAVLAGQFSITRILKSLCDVIEYYCCDMLVLSGQPTCLPGIQTWFRRRQPVPSSRIIWMEHYPLHSDFPFKQKRETGNSKITAALGAMIFRLGMDLRLPEFNVSVGNIKAASTLRYLGVLDENNLLSDENIYCQQQGDGASSQTFTIPIRSNTRLGFRQLDNPRWPATPLYQLTILDPDLARKLACGEVLYVRLRREANHDEFTLIDATLQDGESIASACLRLSLNTLTDSHTANREYWIDSGNLFQ